MQPGEMRNLADHKLTIRDMASGEEPLVFELVMRGFDEVVRADCTEEGVAEFSRAVHSFIVERQPGHHVTVAERDGRPLGMIDIRDGWHVSLFFVESGDRGRGVGRALLETALRRPASGAAGPAEIAVNSSLWAVPIYERLGFTATGPVSEVKGIRFVPMVKRL